MTSEQEYEILRQVGLHYQAIVPASNQVRAWVRAGYPVLIAVEETSVSDIALGSVCPYPWQPAGTHIILVTGATIGGNLLVRDSANVTSSNNAASLRPESRIYNAITLQIVTATVVIPPWRPRPASTTPPEADMNIPTNWEDDGTILTAPNGIPVVKGFRDFILSHPWDWMDMPLTPEYGSNPVELGFNQPDSHNAGTAQVFLYSELCWTQARGVYQASIGREFWTLFTELRVSTLPGK
jgi:hypothetical protein